MRILDPKKTPDSKLVKESGVVVSEALIPANQLGSKSSNLSDKESKGSAVSKAKPDSVKNNTKQSTTKKDQQKKEYEKVYGKGIYLLSMREHSVKEMVDKLSRKCDRIDLVDTVIEDLIERSYLSDDRFTETYVRSRRAKGFGPIKIRSELNNKGINTVMVDEYLESSSAVWFEVAENQYNKKYGERLISDYNAWTKRARFLQSRGFTMEHIHSVIKQPESE